MVEGVYSFHRMAEECRADRPEAWAHSVRLYFPLVRHFLEHYFPGLDPSALLAQVFRAARADGGALWRTYGGSGEKDFLLHLRDFVFEQGRAARGARPETPLTPDDFWVVLTEFPPLQREMLLLSFRGYRPEDIKDIVKFAPASVQAGVERAREKLRARLGEAIGSDIATGNHDALFEGYERQRGKDCLEDKIYVRIADGQASWYDRQDYERHLEGCAHCLNRFASYREAVYFFRTLPPTEAADVAPLLRALELPQEGLAAGGKKPWWLRLLGG
ncbi:MAG: hypothetical protein ACE5IP_08500 [Terriglobia bacterium]